MNVILEGFDGTGKSTLARQISESTGVSVFKWPGRPVDRGQYDHNLEKARLRISNNGATLFDRHPVISEHIYRHNGGANFDDILEELIMCRIDAIVHCTGSALTIRPESDGSVRDELETQNLRTLAPTYLMLYDILMSDLSRYKPVIRYDMTEPTDAERVTNYVRSL